MKNYGVPAGQIMIIFVKNTTIIHWGLLRFPQQAPDITV